MINRTDPMINVIKWFANTLNYQIIAGITRYQLYQGTAGSGLINYD